MHNTIDTAMARRMVEASAINSASVIGQPGGWFVMLKLGMTEKPLGMQRVDKPRMWRSLDACMGYLKNDLGIDRLDSLDASNHSDVGTSRSTRADSSARLKHAHEAAAYDNWFRTQVQASLTEADDSSTHWVSNDAASEHFAAKREELRQRIAASV